MTNRFGNIFDATITHGKMNGFCILYIGSINEIHVGWYKNNMAHGNYMSLSGTDLRILESGWYEKGERKGDMRADRQYPPFAEYEVFYDYHAFIRKPKEEEVDKGKKYEKIVMED